MSILTIEQRDFTNSVNFGYQKRILDTFKYELSEFQVPKRYSFHDREERHVLCPSSYPSTFQRLQQAEQPNPNVHCKIDEPRVYEPSRNIT